MNRNSVRILVRGLHVALAFVHYERVVARFVLLVLDNPNALDTAINLEFLSQVDLGRL